MHLIAELSQDYPELAEAELVALIPGKILKRWQNLILIQPKNESTSQIKESANRLASTHAVHQFLFQTTKQKLKQAVSKFDWHSIYPGEFKIVVHGLQTKIQEKETLNLAKLVWQSLEKQKIVPKVNLKTNRGSFEFFFIKDQVIATNLIARPEHHFDKTEIHNRPAPHPSGMKPKLARTLVNLTGIPSASGGHRGGSMAQNDGGLGKSLGGVRSARGRPLRGGGQDIRRMSVAPPFQAHQNSNSDHTSILVDPMCGAGGFLIEAAVMGISTVGIELDPAMYRRARVNLAFFAAKNYDLKRTDATKIKQPLDYVICDLPYGRMTKKINRKKLYTNFLKMLKRNLKIRAVIVFPSDFPYKQLIKSVGLKCKAVHQIKVHGSLTRAITVLENNSKVIKPRRL